MLLFLYHHWLKAVQENKSRLPPNFQESIVATVDCTERVMRRRDLRRIVDVRIGFDTEISLLGVNVKLI